MKNTIWNNKLVDENNSSVNQIYSLNIEKTNTFLKQMSALQRIQWSINAFGENLYALTSAGIDSTLLIDVLSQIPNEVPYININTGFLPKETLEFRDKLQKKYSFKLYEYGPTKTQIKDINYLRLWDGDLELYSKMTKLDPLTKAVSELKISALLTGVRGDQTANRSKLGVIGVGNDGELRIRPFIDWSELKVKNYFDKHKLLRHPLHKKGFGSVGDIHTTKAGSKREGREVMECGIHMVDGKLVTVTR